MLLLFYYVAMLLLCPYVVMLTCSCFVGVMVLLRCGFITCCDGGVLCCYVVMLLCDDMVLCFCYVVVMS